MGRGSDGDLKNLFPTRFIFTCICPNSTVKIKIARNYTIYIFKKCHEVP